MVWLFKRLWHQVSTSKSLKYLWYDYLRDYDIRFQRQKPLGNYIADFFCADAKLVIEIDGSGHGEEKQQKIDKERTEYMESVGLKVIRFTNQEVNRKFIGVCLEINRVVKERMEKWTLPPSRVAMNPKNSLVRFREFLLRATSLHRWRHKRAFADSLGEKNSTKKASFFSKFKKWS